MNYSQPSNTHFFLEEAMEEYAVTSSPMILQTRHDFIQEFMNNCTELQSKEGPTPVTIGCKALQETAANHGGVFFHRLQVYAHDMLPAAAQVDAEHIAIQQEYLDEYLKYAHELDDPTKQAFVQEVHQRLSDEMVVDPLYVWSPERVNAVIRDCAQEHSDALRKEFNIPQCFAYQHIAFCAMAALDKMDVDIDTER